MIPSLALSAYLGFSRFADGWAGRHLRKRLAAGKEDPERIDERLGIAAIPRPEGPLIWFHAASVGESLSILELLRGVAAEYPHLNILVTTGTRSSASLLDLRLPPGVIHQFVPVDTRRAVRHFLEHWHPALAVWTESEFWPRMMIETKNSGARMILVNGRISEKSRNGWSWVKGMARKLMRQFDLLLVQSDAVAHRFRQMGAPSKRIHVTGSLKEGAVPLPDNDVARKEIAKQIGQRPVWLAASTHAGEEEIVIAAHQIAAKKNPELLLILAPRHPERADRIAAMLAEAGLTTARRSTGEKIAADTQVYLADTLGEMGIWYRLSAVSFIGGSLQDIGGHNPFEPAALGSAIIHGPFVSSFADIYQRLSDGSAAIRVESDGELALALQRCMNPDQAALLASAAWEVSSEGASVTEDVLARLRPFLDEVR